MYDYVRLYKQKEGRKRINYVYVVFFCKKNNIFFFFFEFQEFRYARMMWYARYALPINICDFLSFIL